MSADDNQDAGAATPPKRTRGAQRPSLIEPAGSAAPAVAPSASSGASARPAEAVAAPIAMPTAAAAPIGGASAARPSGKAWGLSLTVVGMVLLAGLVYTLNKGPAEAPRAAMRATDAKATPRSSAATSMRQDNAGEPDVARLENVPTPPPAAVAAPSDLASSPSAAIAAAPVASNKALVSKPSAPAAPIADTPTQLALVDSAAAAPKMRGGEMRSKPEAPVAAMPSERPAVERTAERMPAQAKVDPARDVVVRGPNSNTEDLLNRCRALGVLEGELCRFRICSGRWGTDPACPMSGAPAGANSAGAASSQASP